VLINMAKVGVPESWITILGILTAAGALGLLVGIFSPVIGIAAAIGLVLFFVAAIVTHLRSRDFSFGLAGVFLLFGRGGTGAATASLSSITRIAPAIQ
jgi:hypothetical protein